MARWFVVVALLSCGEDKSNRLPDAPLAPDDGDGTGDGDGGDSDAAVTPAMGCVPAELEADCPAMIAVTTTAADTAFEMARVSMNSTVWYGYQNTNQGQPGVIYPYNRQYSFNCVELADGRRAWNATYRDNCYALNSIGNFRPDTATATFETRESRCPIGRYVATATNDANDGGTCSNVSPQAEIVVAPY